MITTVYTMLKLYDNILWFVDYYGMEIKQIFTFVLNVAHEMFPTLVVFTTDEYERLKYNVQIKMYSIRIQLYRNISV